METQKIPNSQQSWEKRTELEESPFLILDCTTQLQSSGHYGAGTETER